MSSNKQIGSNPLFLKRGKWNKFELRLTSERKLGKANGLRILNY